MATSAQGQDLLGCRSAQAVEANMEVLPPEATVAAVNVSGVKGAAWGGDNK